jgi:LacI family transcriptional regulator
MEAGNSSNKVTMIEIAKAAGVSKSTVSLVLQGSTLVKGETRQRVHEVMSRLGYVYNRGAANLRRSASDVVGMVINDLTNPFFAEMAVGIERGLQSAGYVPFLANTGESPVRQAQVMKKMREHGACGFILCPSIGTNSDFIQEVENWKLPVLTVMRRLPGTQIKSVTPDNTAGARQATAHLLGLGHRKIAFLGGRSGMTVHEDRRAGYRQALNAAGIAVNPAFTVETTPNRDGGIMALMQVLSLPEPPTAVLCFNDIVAFGVLNGLATRGLQAGRDLAVIGFDDVAEAQYTTPPLTTVAVDCRGLGERASQLLLDQINGASPPADFIGEAQLVVRASCGAPGKSMSRTTS